jgi:hypothetical protein
VCRYVCVCAYACVCSLFARRRLALALAGDPGRAPAGRRARAEP